MNYPTAIVLTAIIVGGTVLTQKLAYSQRPQTLQSPYSGQTVGAFEAVSAGGNAVNIVDTRTGRVSHCAPPPAGTGQFECTPLSASPAAR